MKKKCFKALSLVLVFSLLLSVFALTACTDKRKLDDVEKSIVGEWTNMSSFSQYQCILNDDGSFTEKAQSKWDDQLASGTFTHTGDGETKDGISYAIITFEGDSCPLVNLKTFVVFEDEPNMLYWTGNKDGNGDPKRTNNSAFKRF